MSDVFSRILLVLAGLYVIGWLFSIVSRVIKKLDKDKSTGKEKNPWR